MPFPSLKLRTRNLGSDCDEKNHYIRCRDRGKCLGTKNMFFWFRVEFEMCFSSDIYHVIAGYFCLWFFIFILKQLHSTSPGPLYKLVVS